MKIAPAFVALFFGGSTLFAAKISTYQPAQVVLGQASFTSSTPSSTASRMSGPRGVAVDPTTGKVYVADYSNNRVLRFTSAAALQSGASADIALGQSSVNSGGFNSASATSMFHPSGLAFDTEGRLYVADTGFNRVLRFDTPSDETASGVAADCVLGQPDVSTTTATITATGMNAPTAVAVVLNKLWVADTGNHRVIAFNNPQSLSTGATNDADRVLGQTLFTTKNAPTPPTAGSMSGPEGVALGADDVLWVSDTGNNRVLRFSTQSSNGALADAVLGQSDFVTNSTPSAASATNLYRPEQIALDASGATVSLWVLDRVQYRVLRYDDVNNPALADGAAAVVALGQPSLVSETSGTTQRTLAFGYGLAVDGFSLDSPRTLWLADSDNNRVLRFNPQNPAAPVIAGKTSYKTKAAKQKVSGTVSAPAGLLVMRYKGSKGGLKSVNVSGSKWSFTASCKVGTNRFTVFATDKLSRTVSKQFVVKRVK